MVANNGHQLRCVFRKRIDAGKSTDIEVASQPIQPPDDRFNWSSSLVELQTSANSANSETELDTYTLDTYIVFYAK